MWANGRFACSPAASAEQQGQNGTSELSICVTLSGETELGGTGILYHSFWCH